MKTPIIQDEPARQELQPTRADPYHEPDWTDGPVGARHRKTAIFGWLAFVVLAVVLGRAVGVTMIDENTSGVGGVRSRRQDPQTQASGGRLRRLSSSRAARFPRTTPRSARPCRTSSRGLSGRGGPVRPLPLRALQNADQIAADGHAALVEFEISGLSDDAVDKVAPVLAAVSASQAAHPQFFIGEFGDASIDKEIETAFLDDLKKAGLLSLPVTLIILLVVFGALVAASVLLLALTIIAAFGLVAIPGSIVPHRRDGLRLILLIRLAVGVNYSMFYLKREREERAAGSVARRLRWSRPPQRRAFVLISGLTVIIAMAGLFLAGVQGMSAFAVGTIIVVAVAMVGSP